MQDQAAKKLWIEMSIREIWIQAHFASLSYKNIDIKAYRNNDLVFSSIHSFLSHCANVSKMLKAVDDEDVSKTIGDILNISETSAIHKRKFRNNLEHYDKELKNWIRTKDPKTSVGSYNIGPKYALQGENIIFVSHYDPDKKIFTSVNKELNLSVMYNEIVRIKELANNWVNKQE